MCIKNKIKKLKYYKKILIKQYTPYSFIYFISMESWKKFIDGDKYYGGICHLCDDDKGDENVGIGLHGFLDYIYMNKTITFSMQRGYIHKDNTKPVSGETQISWNFLDGSPSFTTKLEHYKFKIFEDESGVLNFHFKMYDNEIDSAGLLELLSRKETKVAIDLFKRAILEHVTYNTEWNKELLEFINKNNGKYDVIHVMENIMKNKWKVGITKGMFSKNERLINEDFPEAIDELNQLVVT